MAGSLAVIGKLFGAGMTMLPGWRSITLASLAIMALIVGAGRVGDQADDAVPRGASSAAGPVAGETYLWRQVAIGGGGFITGLSTDALGRTLVARTDVHGAYLWQPTERRWHQLLTAASMPVIDRVQNGVNEGVFEIAVAPSDAQRIYVAIKGRVYRSDDRGSTFTLPSGANPFAHPFNANGSARLDGPFMAVSPDNPELVYLGTQQDGLWRSLDGARNWSRVSEVPVAGGGATSGGVQSSATVVWFGAAAGNKVAPVYAASAGHGVYVLRGGDTAFAPLSAGSAIQPRFISRVAVLADGGMIALERGTGKVWAYRRDHWRDLAGAGLPIAQFTGIAAKPDGQIYLSDQGGKIWCSADGGAGWARQGRSIAVGEGDPPWLHVANSSYFASGQLLFDPATPGRLWLAGGTGPYWSNTSAACGDLAWKSAARGIEELVANDVVQPPDHAPLFAAWDFGIHRKPDLDRYSTSYGPRERVLIAAQQLDWNAIDPAFIVTNASDTRMTCCSEDGDAVMAGYSVDGGASWRKFATLPQPPGTRADDPWRMSFGTIAVSANDTNTIIWVPAFNRSPFYTNDRGATWQRVILPGEKLPNTGSYASIYGARKTLAADRVLANTFYYYHSGDGANAALTGLWQTQNGGRNWARVYRGEIAPNSKGSAKLRAVPGKPGQLYFTSGVSGGPDTRLRRSNDGGVTWTIVPDVDRVDDVAFGKPAPGMSDPAIYLSGRVNGRYGIWRSIDDAKTWQSLAQFPTGRLDQVSVVEADKNVFGRVYVGYIGSGWLYGEPAGCRAAPFKQGDATECVRL